MLSTDSLPRKWSIRNTCDSLNTLCTAWSSLRAESRSVPNGFSMMTRVRPVASPESPSMPTIEVNATGGMARWYSRLGVPPISFSALWTAGNQVPVVTGLRGRERQVRREFRPGSVVGLGDAEVLARLLGVLAELLVGHGRVRRRRADQAELLGQQARHVQVEPPGQQLALGQVAGRAEQHDDVIVRPRQSVLAHRRSLRPSSPGARRTPSACADRILPVNSPLPRDSNRSYSEAAMTEAGTPSSTAASTVHRPSPESDTRPLKSARSGDLANASAVRSISQELITEPRRHTSATSPTSMLYW